MCDLELEEELNFGVLEMDVQFIGGGTSDYRRLTNKPMINNVELIDNKTSEDLGLQNKFQYGILSEDEFEEGDIIQYIGETNENFVNGYFYKYNENSEWENISVQSSSSDHSSLSNLDYENSGHIGFQRAQNDYNNLIKIKDYLYEIYYDKCDYDFANYYFKNNEVDINIGHCTSLRKENFYGRNLDWFYNESAEFIIKMPRRGDKYANLGVAGSISLLTNSFVNSREYSELYKVLPFYTLDGINEKGVFCNINVVPIGEEPMTETTPSIEEREQLCITALPRYIIDNFSTAEEAIDYIEKYVKLYPNRKLQDMGYESHFMVGDSTNTYILEIINDNIVVLEKSYLTNFRLNGVSFNQDGKVYTPEDIAEGHSPSLDNKIEDFGSGLERFNLVVSSYEDLETKEDFSELMNKLFYTRTYPSCTLPDGAANPFWYTEYVGEGEHGTFTVDTLPSIFDNIVPIYDELYVNRNREKPTETWQTSHSSIYDIEQRKLYIIVQEDNQELEFEFDYYYTAKEVDKKLKEKQDVINDLEEIRQGAALGYTAVQDANYVHTDNNFTNAEKTKLEGIDAGAEVNDIDTIKVQGINQPITNKTVDLDVPTRDDIDDIVNIKTNTTGYIDDALEYRTFNKVIDGNSYQETTEGKNLLEVKNTPRTINGITFTPQNDGGILINGTASGGNAVYPINKDSATESRTVPLKANTTYVISKSSSKDISNILYQVWYTANGSGRYSTSSFTTVEETLLGAYIRVPDGATISNVIIYLQIEKGSTATDYEPYTGGQPSPSPDYPQEIEVIDELGIKVTSGDNTYTRQIDLNNNFIGKLPNGVKDELSIDKWGNVSLLKKIGKVVLDGSQYMGDAGSSGTIYAWYYSATDAIYIAEVSSNLICNTYAPTNTAYQINKTYKYGRNIVFFTQYDNVNDFKSWLSTHNTEVYYELAEPYTVNLGKIGEIKTYKGINNIEVIANLDTTFSVEYAGEASGGSGTSDFEQLSNRPKYNGTTMTHSTNIPLVPTKTSDITNDSGFITSSYHDNTKVNISDVKDNVVSTDTDKPLSANMGKELNDRIQNLASIGKYLAMWDCTTGLPTTNPITMPYSYTTGDYYVISKINTTTNYMPYGSSYDGTASTTEYTGAETLATGDFFYYDGIIWSLMKNTGKTVAFANIGGDPYDNSNLANVLNNKVEKETGKGLSTNDYTTEEKNKLDGIESNAEVNNVDDVKVNGTSVVDNKIANIDLTPYATDVELDNIVSKTTASTTNAGDILTIDDALEYRASANVDGNYEQETTSGKQLFDKDNMTIYWGYGGNETFLNYPTNGTVTIPCKPNTSYTVYGYNNSTNRIVLLCTSTIPVNYAPYLLKQDITGVASITTTNETSYLCMTVLRDGDRATVETREAILNNIVQDMMVVEGTYTSSNLPEYEPYTGGQPSPSPDYPQEIEVIDELGIKVTGKNLAPTNWAQDFVNRVQTQHVKLETIDNRNCVTMPVSAGHGDYDNKYLFKTKWKENTRYTIKLDFKVNNSDTANRFAIHYTDGTKEGVCRTNPSDTWISSYFTSAVGKTIKYITPNYTSGALYVDLDTFMVYEGTDTTVPYEPYKSKTTAIPLNNNFIGKLPNGTKDELSIDKWGNVSLLKRIGKVVLDGSESGWASASLTSGIRYFKISNNIGLKNENSNGSNITSNNFIGCNYETYYSAGGINGISYSYYSSNNYLQLFFKEAFESVDAFKSWLSTHNTEVYYELATPQTINLGKIENLSTYKGVNNIELVTNLGSTFEIEYAHKITGGSSNNYNDLSNKPKINNVELIYNKDLPDLGIDKITNSEIEEIFNF